MNVKDFYNVVKAGYEANKPGIKAGLAMAGVVVVAGESAKAGAKTAKEFEKIKYEEENVDTVDKLKRILPFWIKPVVAAGGTIFLMYSSYKDSSTIIAALGAGYTLKDNAYKDLTEKVEEIAGKKKKEDIEEAIRIDKVQNDQPVEDSIRNTGHGDSLCYDAVLGQWFKANKDFIDNAFLQINKDILVDGYASWGDLLYVMSRIEEKRGLKHTAFDNLGWKEELVVKYTSTLTDDGTPVLVVDYTVPEPEFAFDYYKSQDLHTIL